MRWRLGLDVGTASVGAVAIELDANGNELGVPWHLVRIFQEPNEKGQTGLTPKKAARRLARQQRRQLERRARRIRKIAHLAPLIGLDPAGVPPDGEAGRNLPALRARAARERIELPDLLRVLLRLVKRRGYAGGFRAVKADKELGIVQQGSSELRQQMEELAQKRGMASVTLGEYLLDRIERGLPARLKIGRADEGIRDVFALRDMVRSEFDQIWAEQEKHHPILKGIYLDRPVKSWFDEAIFFQRPLKSAAPSVGLCPLERNLPRAPRAQMAVQAFRIEKTLGDLRWGTGARATPLESGQLTMLRDILNTPGLLTKDGTITFKKIYKILEERGCAAPANRSLNLERASRDELKGNVTLKAFDLMGLLEPWQALASGHQISVINLLADLGSPEQLDTDDWHERFVKSGADKKKKAAARSGDLGARRRFKPEVIAFINTLRNNDGYGRLAAMKLETGRAAYSVKALQRLTEWLQSPSWRDEPGPVARVDEDAAVRECYPERFKPVNVSGELAPPPKTGNDTVDVALAQVYWVIKDALQTLGNPPTEIVIEFGREVGLGAARRNEWEQESKKNQVQRKRARDEIEKHGHEPRKVAIRRYLHWQEQDTHCPYCTRQISLNDALDGQETHIEHIIPRSLTQVGRKRSEVVLAHANCNTQKGDRTPYQAFGETDRWVVIEERAEALVKHKQYRKAKLLLLKDFEQEVLTDESIAEFADRQLHQTSWIARDAAQWLRGLCPDVFAARGEFTAILRRSWRLDTVIPEVRLECGRAVLDTEGNEISREQFDELRHRWEGHGRAPDRVIEKRLDHRHHVVDALVIAQCTRKTYVKLAANYKASLEANAGRASAPPKWQIEPPLADIRGTALWIVRECRVSQKPDRYVSGKLFQDTAYSEVKGVTSKSGKGAIASRTQLIDLVDNKSLEKTRAKIRLIASDEVRDVVLKEFEARISQGQTPRQALSRPVLYPRYGTQIRAVRVIRDDTSLENAVPIRFRGRRGQGEHVKLLLPDGNAYLEMSGEGKEVKGEPVPLYKAVKAKGTETDVGQRFFKVDTVIDSKDQAVLVVKWIKAEAGGSLILAPVFESRPIEDLTARDGRRKISGKGLKRVTRADVGPPNTTAGGSTPPGD